MFAIIFIAARYLFSYLFFSPLVLPTPACLLCAPLSQRSEVGRSKEGAYKPFRLLFSKGNGKCREITG